MDRYKNSGGNSGILAYEIEDDGIIVKFNDGWFYLYTYQSAGNCNIEEMKKMAIAGRGLNSFIMRRVRKKWAKKYK